ncbi:UV damage endonuclease UvsE [Azospirillum sp. BE72]|uniref:UV damage endonuclease UvsE n=1 Tax=Azospirillum sp. BE72 TaxID=2817776 RepID=UPI00286718A2|nr:UV damage endonuclease UvsE [Azospirillum sp. BE72]MDR6772206.1 UV DNA damage repair endonuclease [Azospirillum sp. BE72]
MPDSPHPASSSAPRFGWCCQYVPPDGDTGLAKRMNPGTVTIATLTKLGPARAEEKLTEVLRRNLLALHLQLDEVARHPAYRRLLRVNSGLLPAYTHEVGRPLYRQPGIQALVRSGLEHAGRKAIEAGIRIGLHPDQYCVLNSANPSTLDNSVAELEYHADVLRMMGLAGGWHPQGAHVNIHGGGRGEGIAGFRRGLALLSEDARNLLTVENDEMSFGLDDLLPLADAVPIVLDLHHHWVRTQGEYLRPDDPRIAVVIGSWRGVRPVAHISVSREDLLADWPADSLPDYAALAARGLTTKDLRAHSQRMWNRAVNRLVADHLSWADFEVEAKAKNLAVDDLELDALGSGAVAASPDRQP